MSDKDFLVRHTRGKVGQYVVDGDAHPSNARLSTSFAGFDGDDLSVVHGSIINGEG